jgi:hypothetical protein
MRLTEEQIQGRKNLIFETEKLLGVESFIWMSFCDLAKPKGEQFLGVVITKTLGPTHALKKTWKLGINPGGEIQFVVIPSDAKIDEKYLDRLLQKPELEEAGF